jgi:hypothetical protein
MPKVNYANTIIYKIECENQCYVGHTTNYINRKYQHKCKSTDKCNTTLLYGFLYGKDWSMCPLEEYPCDNLTQARIREQYWIDKLKPNLNTLGSYYQYKYDKQKCEICDGSYHNSDSSKKKHNETHKHRFFLKKNLCSAIRENVKIIG